MIRLEVPNDRLDRLAAFGQSTLFIGQRLVFAPVFDLNARVFLVRAPATQIPVHHFGPDAQALYQDGALLNLLMHGVPDIPLHQEFAHMDAGMTRLPDESTILRFRHMLEAHGLGRQILAPINAKLIDRGLTPKTGTVVDATLIAAPSSTNNENGERKVLNKSKSSHALRNKLEKLKASIRTKVAFSLNPHKEKNGKKLPTIAKTSKKLIDVELN